MAITILPPVVEDIGAAHAYSDADSMSMDSDGGVELGPAEASRPSKRPRLGGADIGTGIVTPGEVVTDDPQWMRFVLFPNVLSAHAGFKTIIPSAAR